MAKSERRKLLEEKMKEINKGKKDKFFIKFATNKPDTEYTSFGIESIDKFTGGGTKKGHIAVVYGGRSVGKTTLVLQKIAHVQKQGLTCCLVDMEHGWEKDRAEKLGVNLENLLIVDHCQTAEEAMDVIIELSKEKLVDVVLLDSINAMSPEAEQQTKKGKSKSVADDTMALLARKLGQFFRIVGPHIYRAKISLVMIGQVRTHGIGSFFTYAGLSGGNALEQWMSTCLFVRQGQKADAPVEKKKIIVTTPDGEHKKTIKEQIGFDCVIRMDKRRNSTSVKEGTDIHVPFYYETGFHPPIPSAKDEPTHVGVKESIKKTCKDLAKDDKSLKKLAKDYLDKEDSKIDKASCLCGHDEWCDSCTPKKEPKKKRGRGRPPKEKE